MSQVLILAICSNQKVKSTGLAEYQPAWRLGEFLPDRLRKGLYAARQQVRHLITTDRVTRDGKLLRDMPFNGHLLDGPDFGRDSGQGSYLPALQRYDGRFYRELGGAAERRALSLRVKHHLLIVSGLYGLLTPTEQIQCYSCHVPDHPEIARTWVEGVRPDLLTSLITAYIRRFRIGRVYDFMAVDAYRNLISWEMVRHAVHGNILHCYSNQFAGQSLLPSLGYLAKRFLVASEEHLLGSRPHDKVDIPNDEVFFLPVPIPEPPLARELDAQTRIVTLADEIGRMRRNIIKVMDMALGKQAHVPFGVRAEELKRLRARRAQAIGDMVYDFGGIRNSVEYENAPISKAKWVQVHRTYDDFMKWASANGYLDQVHLEDTGS